MHDRAEYEKYRAQAPATVETFGGRYAIRRGEPEVLEGDRNVTLSVLLEFDSRERAVEWYNSPQYEDVKQIRLRSATTHAVLLTGNDP